MIAPLFRAAAAAGAMVLSLCAGAFADAPTDRVRVDVRITPTADGVRAHYKLSKAVTRFPLEYDSGRLSKGAWAVTTPGLSYTGGQIQSADARPFDKFDVAVPARNALSGPYYPCVMKIGPMGRVVYASCFAGHQDEFRTTIVFEPPYGAVVMGLPTETTRLEIDRTYFGRQAGPRYVFIGPKAYVRKGAQADYVAGPESPQWLSTEIQRIATRVLPLYAEVTGVALPQKPLFLITTEPNDETVMAAQADVTDGPNVAVRFFGEGWAQRTPLAVSTLDHTVAHEAAHFWNSHHFESQKSDEAPWLHEGGAEYWARVAQRRLGLSGDTDPAIALNLCIDLLGTEGLRATHANVAYACGETLQWFADLGQQTQGRDNFALWREMFTRAEANGRFYSAALFRELAEQTSPAMAEAFRLIFEAGDATRWQKLPPLLAALGVKIEPAPFPADRLRSRIVSHILHQVCGEGWHGKKNFDDHFVLDTGDDCGPLSGDPAIDAVNGRNLFTETAAAYEAIDAACKANAAVVFSRTGSQDHRSVICAAPLPPLPPTFRIAAGG